MRIATIVVMHSIAALTTVTKNIIQTGINVASTNVMTTSPGVIFVQYAKLMLGPQICVSEKHIA